MNTTVTAPHWNLSGTRVVGDGSRLALPKRSFTSPPGPYWPSHRPPGQRLTNPQALLAAFSEAL